MKTLSKDENGNISLMGAAMIVPLVALLGGAVDYSFVYAARMNLERAADTAVIAAISDAKQQAANKRPDQLLGELKNTAKQVFAAEISPTFDLGTVTFEAKAEAVNGVMTASLSYSYLQGTAFLGVIGQTHVNVRGTAVAEGSAGTHSHFDVLVNVSNSMGIGASQSDIDYMERNLGCAFACHTDINQVRAHPVKVRIDVASEAIQRAVDTVAKVKPEGSEVRYGLYRFATTLDQVFPSTHPEADKPFWVKQEVNRAIQLSTEDETREAYAIEELAKLLPDSGDGLIAADPKRYALIITDGAQWLRPIRPEYDTRIPGANWDWGRSQIPDSNACEALKAKGIEVYVLYTTYIPIYTGYGGTIVPLVTDIVNNVLTNNEKALEDCASKPANYFKATDAKEIDEAIEAIFQQVAVPTHLSG